MWKFVIVAVFLLNVAFVFSALEIPEEMKPMINALHDSCVKETSVKEVLIKNANKGDFSTDMELKCYMRCVFESIGVMEHDGTVDFDTLIDLVPDEMRKLAIKSKEECPTPSGGDGCETAYTFNVCLYHLDPTLYILF